MAFDDENSIPAKHAQDDGDEAHFRREAARGRESIQKANDCPRCGGAPELASDSNGHEVACGGCKGRRYAQGGTAAQAVERWNALPADFPCAGFAGCEHRVDDEDGVCGSCRDREPTGGCPGCGGNCQTACR